MRKEYDNGNPRGLSGNFQVGSDSLGFLYDPMTFLYCILFYIDLPGDVERKSV